MKTNEEKGLCFHAAEQRWLLLDILLELEKQDLNSFRWHLYQAAVSAHIPNAKIKYKN